MGEGEGGRKEGRETQDGYCMGPGMLERFVL